MSKSIIILGSSGVGKTHILKKLFNITKPYGIFSAVNKTDKIVNGWRYLPEVTANKRNELGRDKLIQWIKSGNTITDVSWNFRNVIAYDLINITDCTIIPVIATEDEIRRNISSRRGCKGNNDIDFKVKDSLKQQNTMLNKIKSNEYKE